jgi:hypothetical protein
MKATEVLLVVADEPAATGEPGKRSLDQPAFRQHDEALGLIGPLDDGEPPVARFTDPGRRSRSLVAAVGEDDLDEGEQRPGFLVKHQSGAVPVLKAGVVDHDVQQEPERVDEDVVLDAFDLLARVVAHRVRCSPPLARTLWLSMTAAVGLACRPCCSRTRT